MKSPLTDKTKIKAKNTMEKLQKNKLSKVGQKNRFAVDQKILFL